MSYSLYFCAKPHNLSSAAQGFVRFKGLLRDMYAVIFKATINELDGEYSSMAERLRTLAINEYGCTGFHACTEGDKEIAISYWPSEEHIRAWHNDPEHLEAQQLGKNKWYKSYCVNVAKVLR